MKAVADAVWTFQILRKLCNRSLGNPMEFGVEYHCPGFNACCRPWKLGLAKMSKDWFFDNTMAEETPLAVPDWKSGFTFAQLSSYHCNKLWTGWLLDQNKDDYHKLFIPYKTELRLDQNWTVNKNINRDNRWRGFWQTKEKNTKGVIHLCCEILPSF